MNTLMRKTALVAAFAGVSACAFAQTDTGSESAPAAISASGFSAGPTYAIEGVWDEQVTLTRCDTGATLVTFRALDMFIHGGALTDTNSAPTATRGPGFGTWRHEHGGHFFAANMRIFFYNPDGSFGSVRDISRQIEMSSDRNSFTGKVTFDVLTPDGHLLMQGCGSEAATRVE